MTALGRNLEIAAELSGVIFQNPAKSHGNASAGRNSRRISSRQCTPGRSTKPQIVTRPLQSMCSALKKPTKELGAAEIDVRIGATWIDPSYYTQFIYELLKPQDIYYGRYCCRHSVSAATGEWNVSGKSRTAATTPFAYVTYGTKRKNAYSIIEDSFEPAGLPCV